MCPPTGSRTRGLPCPGPEAPAPVTASGATQTARPMARGALAGMRARPRSPAAAAVAAGDDLHRDDRRRSPQSSRLGPAGADRSHA